MVLEDARKVIAAAEKKSQEIGQPMNIAVADEGGNIVAHVRMDGAWLGSIDISQKKAYTSRAFDISTKDLAAHSQSGGQFFGIHASNNGKILKIVTTNVCGSDQHMVRGRTTAPPGLILGHEITGEVVEKGTDVEMLNLGDLVTVPFNIACGRCRNCREGKTGICLTVNPARPGAEYGYVDMGGWVGGQAE